LSSAPPFFSSLAEPTETTCDVERACYAVLFNKAVDYDQ
jgi:hypothetical protein